MAEHQSAPSPGGTAGRRRRLPRAVRSRRPAFRGLILAAGTALVIMAAIAVFLIAKAVPALQRRTPRTS